MTTILLAAITALLTLILIVLFYHLPQEKQSAFWKRLFEVCAASFLIGGFGLGIVGGIVEHVRGIHFPAGVAVIPFVMFSAGIFFLNLTGVGPEETLGEGIWTWVKWTVGLLLVFYWFRLR